MRRSIEFVVYGSVIYTLIALEILIIVESSPRHPIQLSTLFASARAEFLVGITSLSAVAVVACLLDAARKRRSNSIGWLRRGRRSVMRAKVTDEA